MALSSLSPAGCGVAVPSSEFVEGADDAEGAVVATTDEAGLAASVVGGGAWDSCAGSTLTVGRGPAASREAGTGWA